VSASADTAQLAQATTWLPPVNRLTVSDTLGAQVVFDTMTKPETTREQQRLVCLSSPIILCPNLIGGTGGAELDALQRLHTPI